MSNIRKSRKKSKPEHSNTLIYIYFVGLLQGIVHVLRETFGLLLWYDVDTYSMPVAVFILSTTGLSTAVFITLFLLHKVYTKFRVRISPRVSAIESSLVFLFSMGIVSVAAVHLLHQNAAWLVDHILQDAIRMRILAYWIVLLSVSLPLMRLLSQQQYVPQTICTLYVRCIVAAVSFLSS